MGLLLITIRISFINFTDEISTQKLCVKNSCANLLHNFLQMNFTHNLPRKSMIFHSSIRSPSAGRVHGWMGGWNQSPFDKYIKDRAFSTHRFHLPTQTHPIPIPDRGMEIECQNDMPKLMIFDMKKPSILCAKIAQVWHVFFERFSIYFFCHVKSS